MKSIISAVFKNKKSIEHEEFNDIQYVPQPMVAHPIEEDVKKEEPAKKETMGENTILTLKNNDKIDLKMSLELLKQITLIDTKSKFDQFKLDLQEDLHNNVKDLTFDMQNKMDDEMNQKLMSKLDVLKDHIKDMEQSFESRLELTKENFLQGIKLRIMELNGIFVDHINDLYNEMRAKLEEELKQELTELISKKDD